MTKVMHYFSMAARMAEHNGNVKCSRHGAILVKGGKIIGSGYNSIEPHPVNMGPGTNCHAEITSIKDCLSHNRSMKDKYNKSYFQRKGRGLYEIWE